MNTTKTSNPEQLFPRELKLALVEDLSGLPTPLEGFERTWSDTDFSSFTRITVSDCNNHINPLFLMHTLIKVRHSAKDCPIVYMTVDVGRPYFLSMLMEMGLITHFSVLVRGKRDIEPLNAFRKALKMDVVSLRIYKDMPLRNLIRPRMHVMKTETSLMPVVPSDIKLFITSDYNSEGYFELNERKRMDALEVKEEKNNVP